MHHCTFYESRFYSQFLQTILRSRNTCRVLHIIIWQPQLYTEYLSSVNIAGLDSNASIYFSSFLCVEVLATYLPESCKGFMVCTHNVFVVKAQIQRNLCSSYIFLPSVSFELAGEFQSLTSMKTLGRKDIWMLRHIPSRLPKIIIVSKDYILIKKLAMS